MRLQEFGIDDQAAGMPDRVEAALSKPAGIARPRDTGFIFFPYDRSGQAA
jgi:hypothetical protein